MKTIISAAIAALFLTGCGMSPIKINVQPDLTTQSSDVGHGETVHLTVKDARTTEAIGYRMGLSATPAGQISAENNVIDTLKEKITAGLEGKGFNVSDAKGVPLTVKLERLSLKLTAAGVHGTLITESAMQAKTDGYSSVYRGSTDTPAPWRWNEQESYQQHINESLGKALNAMLSDNNLMRALSGS